MNPGILTFMLFGVAAVAGAFVLQPDLSRPTVPLGVSVPSGRVGDPVVRAAIRNYRLVCIALGVVAAAGTVATAARPAANVLWLVG